ncbi:hypothetical protein Trihar35433_350 [Trichoderma harzianum]|nr:hypothetical protein Trihar35433_350 [Trichoderma harzianum]
MLRDAGFLRDPTAAARKMLEKRGQPNDTTCVIHSFVTSSNNLSEREAARFYTPTIKRPRRSEWKRCDAYPTTTHESVAFEIDAISGKVTDLDCFAYRALASALSGSRQPRSDEIRRRRRKGHHGKD